MKIAICINENSLSRTGNWSKPWIEYCEENQLEYKLFNGYDSNIIDQIREYNVLLWHFSGYNFTDMLMARNVLYSAKKMNIKVFPDFNDAWHFDDKIAETYLLNSINAPIPESNIFYNQNDLDSWLKNFNSFPIVAKLRNGSGSHNVKMLKSKEEVVNYSKIMFSKGFNSSPNALYKTSSNIKSAKSLKTFIKRAKRIPEFLSTYKNSRKFSYERGYTFFQEFIPNEGYDLKIVVIGDKLSFIGRNIRPGEFRASGGGDLFYDRDKVTPNVIKSAFETSDKLGFRCMGYDYVVDSKTGIGKIIEISYGFSHLALLESGGHFDRKGQWVPEPINAPKEILKNLI